MDGAKHPSRAVAYQENPTSRQEVFMDLRFGWHCFHAEAHSPSRTTRCTRQVLSGRHVHERHAQGSQEAALSPMAFCRWRTFRFNLHTAFVGEWLLANVARGGLRTLEATCSLNPRLSSSAVRKAILQIEGCRLRRSTGRAWAPERMEQRCLQGWPLLLGR